MNTKDMNGINIIKTLCVGLISAMLLAGCGGNDNQTLESYFSSNESARDSVVGEINGQFESTGAKSSVDIHDDVITVTVDITELAKEQGVQKTNKNVDTFKKEFDGTFSARSSVFENSLSALASKVHSGSIEMKVKIIWEDDTIFSTSFTGVASK